VGRAHGSACPTESVRKLAPRHGRPSSPPGRAGTYKVTSRVGLYGLASNGHLASQVIGVTVVTYLDLFAVVRLLVLAVVTVLLRAGRTRQGGDLRIARRGPRTGADGRRWLSIAALLTGGLVDEPGPPSNPTVAPPSGRLPARRRARRILNLVQSPSSWRRGKSDL